MDLNGAPFTNTQRAGRVSNSIVNHFASSVLGLPPKFDEALVSRPATQATHPDALASTVKNAPSWRFSATGMALRWRELHFKILPTKTGESIHRRTAVQGCELVQRAEKHVGDD